MTDSLKTWAIEWLARHGTALAVGEGYDSLSISDISYRNAIAHAHVSAEVTNAMGIGYAEWLGDKKEQLGSSTPEDEYKDQFNNEVGRQIAVWMATNGYTLGSYTLAQLDAVRDDLVIDALESGALIVDATTDDGNGVDARITNQSASTWTAPTQSWQGDAADRDYDHSLPGSETSDIFPAADWLAFVDEPAIDPQNQGTALPPIPREKPPLPDLILDALNPFNAAYAQSSPLVLDLDGDGIELTTLMPRLPPRFSISTQTASPSKPLGLGTMRVFWPSIAMSNGRIDDASELFGTATVDGFATLAELDSNGDLIIDANDTAWSDLRIWNDANQDATSQSAELEALSAYHIVSIDLAGVSPSTQTISGNPISHKSTFKYANGSTDAIVDAWPVHDNVNSYDIGTYTFDPDTLWLPTLRGYGELPALFIAMSRDSGLKTLVEDFATDWTTADFAGQAAIDSAVEDILFTWAGVDGVATDSRGPSIDARHLEFLEELLGEEWVQRGIYVDPYFRAGQEFEGGWETVFIAFRTALVFQAGGYELFDSTTVYNPLSGEIEGDKDLVEAAINDLIAPSTDTGVDTTQYWIEVTRFLDDVKGLSNLTGTEEGWLNTAIQDADINLSWTAIENYYIAELTGASGNSYSGTSGNDTQTGTVYDDTFHMNDGNDRVHADFGDDDIHGGNGNDTLNAEEGNDDIYGDNGDDTLSDGEGGDYVEGGDGNDTYIYTSGNDVYRETGSDTDTIKLPSGITLNDLSFARVDEYNLLITVGDLGTIELFQQLHSSASFFFDTLTFADTSTFDMNNVPDLITYGTDAGEDIDGVQSHAGTDDTIYAFGGDDSIEGKGGDDIIDGGTGNDTINTNDGNNTVIASPGFDTVSFSGTWETLEIPEAYGASDVTLYRTAAGGTDHLFIQIAGLGQVKASDQFSNSNSAGLDEIIFANGTDGNLALANYNFTTYGTDGNDTSLLGVIYNGGENDTIYGLGGNDTLDGHDGHDILDGGGGNDALSGHHGNDTFMASTGLDTVSEVSGTDTIQYGAGIDLEDLTFTNTGTDEVTIVLNSGTNAIEVSNQRHGDTDFHVEKILFDDGFSLNFGNYANWITAANGDGNANTILGNASANTLSGNGGNDELHGMAGNDTLHGNDGNDLIHGGSGNDRLSGEAGNDMLWGGDGTDTADYTSSTAGVTVDLQNATASGGDAAGDTLTGIENVTGSNTAADIIYGDANANTIDGLGGNDFLEGGAGADVIDGGAGWDNVRYTRSTSGVTVNLATNVSTGGHAQGDLLYNIEALVGSNYDDTLIGNANINSLTGGSGNDILDGRDGNDTLAGGIGTDTASYTAAASGVTVSLATGTATGQGSDTLTDIENITGSAYADTLTGNGSANVLAGGAGGDALDGGGGTDTADYTASTAAVTIDLQNATASGGDAASDTLTSIENVTGSNTAAAIRDTIYGNANANAILGLGGNDILKAGIQRQRHSWTRWQ